MSNEVEKPASVAQLLNEDKVILQTWDNSTNYKLLLNKLLYYSITTWGKLSPKQVEGFFLDLKKTGLLSPHTIAIYYYLLINRAATRQRIAEDLETAEQTIYKNINVLVKEGLVKKAGKIKTCAYGGQKPQIYAVIEATPTEIAEAKNLEYNRSNPAYIIAQKMTQFILEEWLPARPIKDEFVTSQWKREMRNHFDLDYNYNYSALLDVVCQKLYTKGIKVVR